ncbi:MAG: DUF4340 domain-containing protein [Planctomycetota bacterium]
MNPRTTIVLIVALAVAVIGVWWAQSSASKDEGMPSDLGPRSLLDPALGDLAGFEIKAGTRPALVFEMRDDKWRMTSPVSWPAEHNNVNADANLIKRLRYVKAYPPDDPDRPTPEMTSLDKPLKIVKLTDTEDNACVVKIGSLQKLSKKTYVQLEGDEAVYLIDADLNGEMRKGLSDYRGKLVAGIDQAEAARISVTGECQYTLVKTDGKWRLDAPVKGRADASKVQDMVRSLSNLQVERFVDDAPQSLRPFGLEPPRLRIVVEREKAPEDEGPPSPDQEPEYERLTGVAIGGKANDEVFAKIDDAANSAVFQVKQAGLSQIEMTLNDLRDKKITSAGTNRAQKIVVTTDADTIELAKLGGRWSITSGVEGDATSQAEFAAVDQLLKAVRDLDAIAFETTDLPTHGFDNPRATIELTAEGQLPVTLTVGALTPSKTGAYIRNEQEGFVAVVKADAADALVVKPTAFWSRDLLKFSRAWASNLSVARVEKQCEVAREGGVWRFTSPVQAKAEIAAVNNILSDLSNLRGRRVVGKADEAARYGLQTPAVRATITVESPPKPKTATSQPSSASASAPATAPAETVEDKPGPPVVYTVLLSRHDGQVYAMLDGGATICEVDAKILEDLEAELLDTLIAPVQSDEVIRLACRGDTKFTFEKDDDEWRLEGEPSFQTDGAKIKTALTAIQNLQADRYVRYSGADPAEFGLEQPAIVVEVQTTSGDVVSLLISSRGPEAGGQYASTSTTPDRVFVLKAADVATFRKQVQDFHKGG